MITIVDSVSSRESEQYLDENSKRYTGMLGNTPDIVDGMPLVIGMSDSVKTNPRKSYHLNIGEERSG